MAADFPQSRGGYYKFLKGILPVQRDKMHRPDVTAYRAFLSDGRVTRYRAQFPESTRKCGQLLWNRRRGWPQDQMSSFEFDFRIRIDCEYPDEIFTQRAFKKAQPGIIGSKLTEQGT